MDAFPKITEINSLKDLSAVIVLPILCASYIYQTGYSLEFDSFVLTVDDGGGGFWHYFKFSLILIFKIFLGVGVSVFLYYILLLFHVYVFGFAIHVVILTLLTMGFLGVFFW